MNNTIALHYVQANREFYITTLDFETINRIAEVLIYGKNNYGYQRAENQLHINRIVATLKEGKDIISPTSIVLGVDKKTIETLLTKPVLDTYQEAQKMENVFILNLPSKMKNIFRIIDGQHRLAGLRKYINESQNLALKKEYVFSVIIMVVEENMRREEVKVFQTINSKAKPLKTDLAMLAMYNYDILEKKVTDLLDHLITRVIFQINNNKQKYNCWENGIKVDVNDTDALGIVGFKSYYESIYKMCNRYASDYEINEFSDFDFDYINKQLNTHAEVIVKEILLPCWKAILQKWPDCFLESEVYMDDEISRIFYNKNYYIQRNMGARALNYLMSDIYDECKEIKESVQKFSKVISLSDLSATDWEVGGEFQGLSSESGINLIKQRIVG